MTRQSLPCLILLLLVTATAISTAATAQERQEDTSWREEPRSLELEPSSTEARFQSERTTGHGDDRIDVRFERDPGQLEYQFSSFDENGEGTRLTFRVHLDALVEFRDPDGGERYDLDAEIVERFPLNELDPAPLSSTSILQGRGYQASAEYAIPDPGEENGPLGGTRLSDGILRIGLVMVETPRTVEGEPLDPTQLRIHVTVEDHPFTAPDTRLALEARVTGTRMASVTSNETGGIIQHAGALESRLGWSPTATIQGDPREVHITLLSHGEGTEGTETAVLAAYPQSDDIGHSWTLGTRRFAVGEEVMDFLTRGDPLVFTTALVATLAAAGWPVVRRLGER